MNHFVPEDKAERDERRQRLAVLCALDRAELRLALRPPPPATPAGESAGGLRRALDVASILPGGVGRWSRRISTGLRLLQGLGAAVR